MEYLQCIAIAMTTIAVFVIAMHVASLARKQKELVSLVIGLSNEIVNLKNQQVGPLRKDLDFQAFLREHLEIRIQRLEEETKELQQGGK